MWNWLNDQRSPGVGKWLVQTTAKFVIFVLFLWILGIIIL